MSPPARVFRAVAPDGTSHWRRSVRNAYSHMIVAQRRGSTSWHVLLWTGNDKGAAAYVKRTEARGTFQTIRAVPVEDVSASGPSGMRRWRGELHDGTAFERSSSRYQYTHVVVARVDENSPWREYAWTTSEKAATSHFGRARRGVGFCETHMLPVVEVPLPRVRILRTRVFDRVITERVTHTDPVRFVVATRIESKTPKLGRRYATAYRWCKTEDEARVALTTAQADVTVPAGCRTVSAMAPVEEITPSETQTAGG